MQDSGETLFELHHMIILSMFVALKCMREININEKEKRN